MQLLQLDHLRLLWLPCSALQLLRPSCAPIALCYDWIGIVVGVFVRVRLRLGVIKVEVLNVVLRRTVSQLEPITLRRANLQHANQSRCS